MVQSVQGVTPPRQALFFYFSGKLSFQFCLSFWREFTGKMWGLL